MSEPISNLVHWLNGELEALGGGWRVTPRDLRALADFVGATAVRNSSLSVECSVVHGKIYMNSDKKK